MRDPGCGIRDAGSGDAAATFDTIAGVASPSSPCPLRHFVAFKYKAGASAEDIQRITLAFRRLQRTIPGIVAMEDGVNDSPEGKSHGFTHCYVLTFADAAARDSYLPHP